MHEFNACLHLKAFFYRRMLQIKMLIYWCIDRYARCYSDSSKQCLDFDQIKSIFQYFAHLDTQKSQAIGHFWSAINACDSWKLNLSLELSENRKITLMVAVIDNCTNQAVVLVQLSCLSLQH